MRNYAQDRFKLHSEARLKLICIARSFDDTEYRRHYDQVVHQEVHSQHIHERHVKQRKAYETPNSAALAFSWTMRPEMIDANNQAL